MTPPAVAEDVWELLPLPVRRFGPLPTIPERDDQVPALAEVMAQADQNQSRAAQWLGLNRNTLRKKLLQHELL